VCAFLSLKRTSVHCICAHIRARVIACDVCNCFKTQMAEPMTPRTHKYTQLAQKQRELQQVCGRVSLVGMCLCVCVARVRASVLHCLSCLHTVITRHVCHILVMSTNAWVYVRTACTYACIHVHIEVCLHMYRYTCMSTRSTPCLCMYVCMYRSCIMHTYLPTYIHTYIHTCIHVYMYAYIHTYIHTYSSRTP
jgi:hypothetical protein